MRIRRCLFRRGIGFKFRQEIVINELELSYTVQGNGPPALLLHGYAHTSAMWQRPIQAYLQSAYRCYALDLPGHGHSTKPPLEWFSLENFSQTIYEFCQQLGLEHVLLIGYSMGGLIALDVTSRYPSLVDKLIIINAPAHGEFLKIYDPLLHLEWLIDRPFARWSYRLYHSHFLFSIPVEQQRYAAPRMILSESCQEVRRQMALCSLEAIFGCFKTIRQANLQATIPHISQPMLVITSDRDRVVPPTQTKLIASQAAHAQLVIIPNCGHLPIDEQPEPFDAALKQFLDLTA